MRRVLSPKGWARFVVEEVEPAPKSGGWLEAGLMPPPVLAPLAGMADVAGLCTEEKIGVCGAGLREEGAQAPV
jgi:hypothetical protein